MKKAMLLLLIVLAVSTVPASGQYKNPRHMRSGLTVGDVWTYYWTNWNLWGRIAAGKH